MFRAVRAVRSEPNRSAAATGARPYRSPAMIWSNWSCRTMLLVQVARNSLMAVLLTVRPISSACWASSISRTISSSPSGNAGSCEASRPATAAASIRNRLVSVRRATPRSSCPSRSSPPFQETTTGSAEAGPLPICRNGGSTKKANMARTATATSIDRWYFRKKLKDPAMKPPVRTRPGAGNHRGLTRRERGG